MIGPPLEFASDGACSLKHPFQGLQG